jgi:hypothetical protein
VTRPLRAPYEFIEILANEQQYGGGGIFNDQATTAVDTGFAEYVFVHEFGHHFAGLADEYYTSDVAYETGASDLPEPWEPNVTAPQGPEPPQVARSRRGGHAAADAVGQDGVRDQEPRITRRGGESCSPRRCPKPRSMRSSVIRWPPTRRCSRR